MASSGVTTGSFVQAGDLRVHYALSGAPSGAPVVLSHSLGTSLSLWDPQLPALEGRLRVLRYDLRGHGLTSVTPGPYTLERLARDVVALLDALDIARAHFCGLSIGGLVGMWLGIHAAERIDRLVLCNTAAHIGSRERWDARIQQVLKDGVEAIAADMLQRWFTRAFLASGATAVASARRMLVSTSPEGYAGCSAAIRDADVETGLGRIRAPTLVIAGAHDPATPPADGRALAQAIPGARYRELEASHLSNLEAAERFNAELIGFLAT